MGMANEKKRNIDGQISLFGIEEDIELPEINYPNIKEFAKKNLHIYGKRNDRIILVRTSFR